MLRLKFFADALKLFFNPLNLLLCRGALLGIQLRRPSACQPPLGAVHNRGYHLQIADQFSNCRRFLDPLRFEEQGGIVQNAFADGG